MSLHSILTGRLDGYVMGFDGSRMSCPKLCLHVYVHDVEFQVEGQLYAV